MPIAVLNNFSKGLVSDNLQDMDSLSLATNVITNRVGNLVKRLGWPAGTEVVTGSSQSAHVSCYNLSRTGAYDSSGNQFDALTSVFMTAAGSGCMYSTYLPDEELYNLSTWVKQTFPLNPAGNYISPFSDSWGQNNTQFNNYVDMGSKVIIGKDSSHSYLKWSGCQSSTTYGDSGSGTVYFTCSAGSSIIDINYPAAASTTVRGLLNHASGGVVGKPYICLSASTSGIDDRMYAVNNYSFASTSSRLYVDSSLPVAVAAGASSGYRLQPFGYLASPPSIFGSASSDSVVRASCVESHNGRIFAANTLDYKSTNPSGVQEINRIRWSGLSNEAHSASSQFVGEDFWQSNAYVDVYPGVGSGGIRNIVSYGDELLIFKRDAIFSMRGAVASDGANVGASISIVSPSIGVHRIGAVKACGQGVLFWHDTRPYIYSNGTITDLTQGKANSTFDREYYSIHCNSISVNGDIAIFSIGRVGSSGYDIYIDLTDGSIWKRTSRLCPTTNIVSIGMGFKVCLNCDVNDNSFYRIAPYYREFDNGWGVQAEGDYLDAVAQDASSVSATDPQFWVRTQPIPIANSPSETGRVNNVYITLDASCSIASASSSAALYVTLHPGEFMGYANGDVNAVDNISSIDLSSTLTYTILASSLSSVSQVVRIPVDSFPDHCNSVTVELWDDKLTTLNVHAIGVEYEPSRSI